MSLYEYCNAFHTTTNAGLNIFDSFLPLVEWFISFVAVVVVVLVFWGFVSFIKYSLMALAPILLISIIKTYFVEAKY